MHSPVVVNLLGPETNPDEAADHTHPEGIDVDYRTGAEADGGDNDGGNATLVTTPERRLRRTVLLGSGLPTAGALVARLGPNGGAQTEDLPPGTGYAIEVSHHSFM